MTSHLTSADSPSAPGSTVDDLAQEIRRVDGNHALGAGALAEALLPFVSRIAGGAWHDALFEQCAVIETGYVSTDPKATVQALIDWHVRAEREPLPGAMQWPLRARIWNRTSQGFPEKILEIDGAIGETHFTCRFPQSGYLSDDEVVGLPEYLYIGPLEPKPAREEPLNPTARQKVLLQAIAACLQERMTQNSDMHAEDIAYNTGIRHAVQAIGAMYAETRADNAKDVTHILATLTAADDRKEVYLNDEWVSLPAKDVAFFERHHYKIRDPQV